MKNITVKHMVNDELQNQVDNEQYYICTNDTCDIVYYKENKTTFSKKEIKVPVWFKKDASPKYICYCNHVTEEQIINAVLKDGAKNISDVVKLTGAMKNGQCVTKNPSGKCCSPLIKETIKKALKQTS